MQAELEYHSIKSSEVIENINMNHTNIWSFLKESFSKFKTFPAYVCSESDRFYTYEDVIRGSANWATVLMSLSTDSSPPPVAVLSPNTIEVNVVTLGALRIGARLHMINYQLPLDVLQEILEQSDSNIIITDVTLLKLVTKLVDKIDTKLHIFVSGVENSDIRSIDRIIQDPNVGEFFQDKKLDPQAEAFIFFSSGTTGKPKGVVESHASILSFISTTSQRMNYPLNHNEKQRINAVIGTFSHVANFTLMAITIYRGGKVILIRGFELTNTIQMVQKYKIMSIHIRPHLLDDISRMENPKESLKSIKCICTFGMALTAATVANFRARVGNDIELRNWYGSTEAGTISYGPIDPVDPTKLDLGPNIEVRILDIQAGKMLGPNQIGEICIKGPMNMVKYFKNPEASKATLDEEGFVHTGDSGYYTEDLKLVYFERIKDIIEVYGKKVSPIAIESVLLSHPSVLDAGVTGVAVKDAGELPIAFVVKSTNEDISEDELVSFVDERVKEHEKLVKGIRFVNSIPRNHMGKIERRRLKEKAWRI